MGRGVKKLYTSVMAVLGHATSLAASVVPVLPILSVLGQAWSCSAVAGCARWDLSVTVSYPISGSRRSSLDCPDIAIVFNDICHRIHRYLHLRSIMRDLHHRTGELMPQLRAVGAVLD